MSLDQVSTQCSESKTQAKDAPRVNKVHNCLLCEAKDGKNLAFDSELMEVRNHYSVCFYNLGKFKGLLDPGEENRDSEGNALDEYGRKFRYKCQVPKCPRNERKAKSCGFKEWAIHTGVAHFAVEKVMEVEVEKNPLMMEVLEEVRAARTSSSVTNIEGLLPIVEEIHTCLLCGGKDKQGLNLSFSDPSQIWSARYPILNFIFHDETYNRQPLLSGTTMPVATLTQGSTSN